MADLNEEVHQNVALRRTLADYMKPSLRATQPSVIRPAVQANNFSIPPQIITMIQNSVQFEGMPEEDPNAHVALFLEVCDTFKIDGVSDDAIKLRLFPFSLRGRAKSWLNSLPVGSITTWEEMAEKFLSRYFPPSKTTRLRNNIYTFLQDDGESLYETWERFKELLRKCPHHGLELWQRVQMFYNGLNTPTRQIVDITAGGSLNTKTPEEALSLFEELAMSNYEWPTTRSRPSTKKLGIYNVDSNTILAAQVEALSSKIDRLAMENLRGNEKTEGTFNSYEHVDGVKSKASPTIDLGSSRDEESGPNASNAQIQPHQHSIIPDAGRIAQLEKRLEEMISQFFDTYHSQNQIRLEEQKKEIQSQKKVIQSLEERLRQIIIALSKQKHGSFLGHLKHNPKEQVKSITMRSNRAAQVNKSTITSKGAIEEKERESPSKVQKTRLNPTSITRSKELVKEYKSPLPYHGRLEKEKFKEQHGKFLDPYKQLHVNLPFVESLTEMPKYTQFLKDLLTNKKNLEELSIVTMNEECSAILQNKLPQKITDPGSFTVPCLIGGLWFNNALADLGSSINLMPYSVFVKLDLGEPKPTHMSLQLADRTLKYPRGVVENMLVKIDRFVFPIDFVILDMDEDENVPLILGRPFLATSRALIDVFDGKLTLRVADETITFDIKNTMRHTQGNESLYFVKTIMLHVGRCMQEVCQKDTLETQILDKLNQDIKLTSSITELKNNPLGSKSPLYLKLFEVIERQEPEMMLAIEPTYHKLTKLSSHPKCALLDDDSKYPMILSRDLLVDEKENLPTVLRKHKKIITWKTMDIKFNNPYVCMHKIQIDEDFKSDAASKETNLKM